MDPLTTLAKIQVPPELVVPVLIGCGVLIVLLFSGAALTDWKAKHPSTASKVGLVVAVLLTGYALYTGVTILPAKYISRGAPGELTIGFLDGPIMGTCGLLGALFWRFANQRWIALGVGLGIGIAMFVKPFIMPLYGWYDYKEHAWSFMDPEHLSFHGPGVAVMIAGLVGGLRK